MSIHRKFLTAIATPFQTLEDTIRTLIRMRDVRYATGIWLDQLGNFVGQPRGGIADDDIYRRYVQARILTNKSDGQPETMYQIARRILGDTEHMLKIKAIGNCTFTMEIGGAALTYQLGRIVHTFLQQAASSGVRVTVEFSTLAPADTFGFEDSDGAGFLSFDETTGGGWACAIG